MSLAKYLKEVTHREHLTWMAHLEGNWNPDLLHFYLMRVAQRVQQSWCKNPNQVDADSQRVELERREEMRMVNLEDLSPEEIQELAAKQKARWGGK